MSAVYPILVAAHASVGVVALVAFWSAAALRKGSVLHRRTGQAYLLAMLAIIVTAIPMVGLQYQQGRTVTAAFLAYLVIIVATGVWGAWRAIRDKHDVDRYTGAVYQALAWLCLASGIAVLALGLRTLVSGTLATLVTAATIGMLLGS